MILRALIFDVDGTLADTEEVHRRAFNAAFERAGLDWAWSRTQYRELLKVAGGKERMARYVDGLDLRDAERRSLQARIAELHAEKTRIYSSIVAAGQVPLRDGVARLLRAARDAGCQLAIASTTTAANVDALLQAALGPRGLEMFDVIACGDVVGAKKPAPDIYQLALRTLGVTPDEAIAFEDSVNGLRAAVDAGLWTVLTPTYWTEGGDFSDAALVLPRLGDPQQPLEGEPGGRLARAAWLTMDELVELHAPPPVPCAVRALYQGAC